MNENRLLWIGVAVGVVAIGVLAATVDLWPGASSKGRGPDRGAARGAAAEGRPRPATAKPTPAASKPAGLVRVDNGGTVKTDSSIPANTMPITVEQSVAEVRDPETGRMRQVPFTITTAVLTRPPGAPPLKAIEVDLNSKAANGKPLMYSVDKPAGGPTNGPAGAKGHPPGAKGLPPGAKGLPPGAAPHPPSKPN
jgi:hypothetical protein